MDFSGTAPGLSVSAINGWGVTSGHRVDKGGVSWGDVAFGTLRSQDVGESPPRREVPAHSAGTSSVFLVHCSDQVFCARLRSRAEWTGEARSGRFAGVYRGIYRVVSTRVPRTGYARPPHGWTRVRGAVMLLLDVVGEGESRRREESFALAQPARAFLYRVRTDGSASPRVGRQKGMAS